MSSMSIGIIWEGVYMAGIQIDGWDGWSLQTAPNNGMKRTLRAALLIEVAIA